MRSSSMLDYWIRTFLLIASVAAILSLLFDLVKEGRLIIGLMLVIIAACLLSRSKR